MFPAALQSRSSPRARGARVRWLGAVLAASLAGWGWLAGAHAADVSPKERLRDILEAIVPLRAEIPADAHTARYLGTERLGTGLVIGADGLVLTIGYLIVEASSVQLLVKGRAVAADVVAYDHASGFGLVRARERLGVRPLALGSSQAVSERQPVMVASYGGEDGLRPAVVASRRDFAGYWEYVLEDAIFTAPPHPHPAGAALLSFNGELLGVGYLLVADALVGEDEPGNMFVPIDRLKPILGDLLTRGRSRERRRPWLGVFSQAAGSGMVVIRVAEDGPAARAGITVGDVILGVGDSPIGSLMELYRSVWSYGPPGAKVPLVVLHEGKLARVEVASGDAYDWFKGRRR